MNRPNWDEYFLGIVDSVSKRATCDRGKSGCVITKNNRILVTGYVGAPSGFLDCSEEDHIIEARCDVTSAKNDTEKKLRVADALASGNVSFHCIRTLHAEMNAILQAARTGVSLEGSTLYCTMTPCRNCTMSIIQVGISRVVCKQKYQQSKISEDMFAKANIDLVFKNETILQY